MFAKAFLTCAWQALRDLYPNGLQLFWLAPLIPAFVIVPEFIQHVVEMKLGMFESKDAFKALQNDPTRWNFGYAKIAGLWLTILASARFWGVQNRGGRWWDLRDMSWAPLLLGLAIFGGLGSLPMLWDGRLEPAANTALEIVVGLITLPGLLLIFGGLFGDPLPTARGLVVRGWPYLLLIALLVAAGFGPAAWVHQKNHVWAMGLPAVPLWLVMIWDSMLVGLLACLSGTAIALGYRRFAADVMPR